MKAPNCVHVTAAPMAFQPDRARVELTLPEGMTIAEMVAMALPGAVDPVLARTRVALVKGDGMQIVPRALWHRARPHAGVHVVIRVIPGQTALRSVLTILVSVAAIAIAGFFFPAGATLLGSEVLAGVAKTALTVGLTALGGLLINALLPLPGPDKPEKSTFAIAGWQNQFTPDAPVPDVMGTHRYAPPFAAMSYIEVVGDFLYDRAVFVHGYGPLEISEEKLGDTLLTKYDEIEIETRYGYADDAPLSLYVNQVLEERVGADLERPFPKDDMGEQQHGVPSEAKPVSRFTAPDSKWAIAILSFPAGLIKIDDEDGDKQATTVELQRRFRLVGNPAWTDLPVLRITAKKAAGFYREDRIEFPVRGAYEIEYERLNDSEQMSSSGPQIISNCTWVVLQSWRPEYPFNFRKPVALSALRIKATAQLNGTLDNFNTLDKRIAPDWDAGSGTWVDRVTQNPASLALRALRGPALYRPVPDDQIDFPAFEDWHVFCAGKGLKYNRIHDFDSTLGQTRAAIGAAGRAAVRWNGRKWTVVIDRPRELVVDHVNPRNSSDFRWSPSYFEPPHALRVPFIDETNDYQQAERLVPWPGHIGPIDITEELKLPGKTDPVEIWRETRRRQYEIMNRAVDYSAVQQGTARTATSGDLVVASRDVLKRATHSARVKAVRGDHVETDGIFTMVDGQSYAIRFRQFDADDTIGTSVVRTITTVAGESAAVRLTGTGERPKPGDILHFGPAVLDSIPLIITGISRGKNNSSVLAMKAAAPIIDELTDAEEPPPWSGRVGSEIDVSLVPPAVPVFTGVDSGTIETGDANGLIVMITRGTSNAVPVVAFELQHRLAGALAWQPPLSCTPASGTIAVTGYVFGDTVEMQAWAVSVAGVDSGLTVIISVIIGADDFVTPVPANSFLLLVL
ncbi:phage tail protein [Mesorhizobium sp. M0923]|uniref:TipJ family phage tail tip protein n=1 Tax=Mesorhizobium sp. M0923 TaxID=2957028 RepID=UPI00333C7878